MDPFEDFNLSLCFVSYIPPPCYVVLKLFGFLNLEIRNYNVVSDLCYLRIYIPRDACRFLAELVCVALTLKPYVLKIRPLRLKVRVVDSSLAFLLVFSIFIYFLIFTLNCNISMVLLFYLNRCGENGGMGFESPLHAMF
jgi:hypothetical protein